MAILERWRTVRLAKWRAMIGHLIINVGAYLTSSLNICLFSTSTSSIHAAYSKNGELHRGKRRKKLKSLSKLCRGCNKDGNRDHYVGSTISYYGNRVSDRNIPLRWKIFIFGYFILISKLSFHVQLYNKQIKQINSISNYF